MKRFWWAVSAPDLSAADRAFVGETLLAGERALFERMSRADQAHHVRVARRFAARCAVEVPRPWLAGALLHDVDKLVCGLGTWARVWVTVWPFGRRGDGRVGQYHRHEAIGAILAREAGSDPVTVALVAEWPEAPEVAARALHWADDL